MKEREKRERERGQGEIKGLFPFFHGTCVFFWGGRWVEARSDVTWFLGRFKGGRIREDSFSREYNIKIHSLINPINIHINSFISIVYKYCTSTSTLLEV